MKVVVIDYGMSNLGSISNALVECGCYNVVVATDPKELSTATHIILPGVGSFADGMNNLIDLGWQDPLRKSVMKDKIPLLGICLGMQLLASQGIEGGNTAGLNFIEGSVERLIASKDQEKIPHVGWNEVYSSNNSPLFSDISDGTDFYFVHSYHFVPSNKKNIMSTTPYCGKFVSGVNSNNIFGTQFHPEKSQRPGFQILKNFLNL
jgi:glutamine amidotransferase